MTPTLPTVAQPAAYASLGRRAAAFVLDLVVVWAIFFALRAARVPVEAIRWTWWLVFLACFVLLPASPMQATIGKRLLGLRIADREGRRIGLGRALARFGVGLVSLALAGTGFAVAAWTARRQALHDLAAGTLVLHRTATPEQVAAGAPKMDVVARVGWSLFLVAVIVVPAALLEFGFTRGRYETVSALVLDAGGYLAEVDKALAEGRPPPPATKVPPRIKSIAAQPDGSVVLIPAEDLISGGRIVFHRRAQATEYRRWKCTLEDIRLSYLPPDCRD